MERAWEHLHGYTGKGLGDLRNACYLFASCNFCKVGVVGFTARSDTFHAAVRVERNGGIYWLYYGDLGREDSNLFSVSVSLFPFTSRISISFVAKKGSANTRLESLLAAPLVGISYAPSRLGT